MLSCASRFVGRPWLPWLVWGIGAFFIAYQFSFQVSSAIMVQGQMHDFHLNGAGLGFLSSTFFYTYLLLQVPAGFMLDVFGPRRMMIAGVALFVFGLYCFSIATHLWSAVLARMLIGLAAAPAVAAALCLGANWFSPTRFALIVGLSETFGAAGGLFGEGVMAHWVNVLGWRHSLWVWIVMGVLLWLMVIVWVEDYPATTTTSQKNAPLPNVQILVHLKEALMQRGVWLNGIFCGLMFAVNSAFAGLWAVPYLEQVHHMSRAQSAWLVMNFFVGVMVASPLLGWLCDRYGHHRLWMRWGALLGVVVSTTFIFLPNSNPLYIAVLLFWMGAASAVYVIPFANVKAIVSLEARGAAMAFTNTACIAIGAPILQPVLGLILTQSVTRHHIDRTPVYSTQAFQIATASLVVCALLALILSFFLRPRPERYDPVELEAPALSTKN